MKNYNYKLLNYAFRGDAESKRAFLHALSNYEKGRHILDLMPSFIYDLKNGQNARRRALNLLFSPKFDSFNFMVMKTREIMYLSELAYDAILEGINVTIKSLDLNIYISPEKIINAGGAIKNHKAEITFGGKTIRDYICYMSQNVYEKDDITPKELTKCKTIIKQKEAALSYTNIKSYPFALLNYKENFTIRNGKVEIPDIEAKINLRKILGSKDYEIGYISKISIKDATICEDLLIKKMRALIQEEISETLNELNISNLPDAFKTKIEHSANINNITMITDKGQIKDIVDNIKTNVTTLIDLFQHPDKELTPAEADCIFRMEYAAMQEEIDFTQNYSVWLMEFGAAKSGKHVTFDILSEIMLTKCSPYINGSPLTDFIFKDTAKVKQLLKEYAKLNIDDAQEKDNLLSQINQLAVC